MARQRSHMPHLGDCSVAIAEERMVTRRFSVHREGEFEGVRELFAAADVMPTANDHSLDFWAQAPSALRP